MTVIASLLFLTAIMASSYVLWDSIAGNMPRILEVVENRGQSGRHLRVITAGPMRATSARRTPAIPHFTSRNAAPYTARRLSQRPLPIAAVRLPLAA
ncbi:MAG: hypothetical protein KAZ17_01385 [Sphingorhabdus sp.]|nr:hypothetical protein [Sphingorhabdus sp.]